MGKAEILILGTYHFKSNKCHLIDIDPGDITDAKNQNEIDEVIQSLVSFKPNKIAVEVSHKKYDELNKAYLEYCKGNLKESSKIINHRIEVVQLGFKLGHILNHNKIYSLDVPVNLSENVFEYAKENYTKLYENYMNKVKKYGISQNQFISNHTIIENLRYLNNPNHIEKEHSDFYLNLAQIKSKDAYYGVDMLADWYKRNLYIFSNLQNISKPGDKILVIYGSGHCKLLRDLVRDYNDFELIDPLNYLNEYGNKKI